MAHNQLYLKIIELIDHLKIYKQSSLTAITYFNNYANVRLYPDWKLLMLEYAPNLIQQVILY
jgi:hypothetical protein